MEAKPRAFLESLLSTPGTSGYEVKVQDLVRAYLADVADEITTDLHGNVIACKNPGQPLRLMFAGHCDQIGLIVSQIDENGFIYFQPIGGWDPNQLIGQRVTVWASAGPVNGVCSRKPIHLQDENERKQVVPLKDLWIDIGSKSQEETRMRVKVGDSITLQLGLQEMGNDMINAPACDDRSGVWVVIEAFRRASREKLNCSLYVVSTVQEEVGLRGARTAAFAIDPHVGIAVDVTHATDCPTIDKRQQGEIAIGKGPVVFRGPNMNPHVVDRLVQLSDRRGAPYQIAAIGRAASNDTNAMQINRGGVATGCVAIPNRYMHSAVEVISLNDIEDAANLLSEFALSCNTAEEFVPK
jgi:endoglucanase